MPPTQAPQAGGPQAEITKLMDNVGQGLSMLVDIMEKTGAPEQALSMFEKAHELFSNGVQALGGGEGETPNQPSTPEQGGAEGAQPMNPGMMR